MRRIRAVLRSATGQTPRPRAAPLDLALRELHRIVKHRAN